MSSRRQLWNSNAVARLKRQPIFKIFDALSSTTTDNRDTFARLAPVLYATNTNDARIEDRDVFVQTIHHNAR